MIRWELLERYKEQDKRFEELKQRYDAKVQEAEQALQQACADIVERICAKLKQLYLLQNDTQN